MSAIAGKDTTTRTIHVRVPLKVYEQLETLARTTAQTKSLVTQKALSSYFESESWQVQEIAAGIADAEHGDFATDEQINAVFVKHGA